MSPMRLIRGVSGRGFGKLLPLLAAAFALAPAGLAVRAQQNPLPPLNGPGQLGPKPPVGSGGCSITAPTCADVAPTTIHSALGPSPLGPNVRLLAAMLAGHKKEPGSDKRVAQWVVGAFRKAGVDEVHVENYPLPAEPSPAPHGGNRGPFETRNVVAVIRGRTQAAEFVILGAGWDARGSAASPLDAACNAALVVDAARAIHAAGVRPLRSIRFVLFGGDNQGMAGSQEYARAHRSGLDRADAVIIYDAGDGPVTGYDLEGRRSLEPRLRKALAPAAQFGANHDSYGPEMERAAFSFLLAGVPTIVTNPQGSAHAARTVDLPALKRHVALVALTAYGIADLPQRLGTRLTRPQIKRLLEQTGLESEMKMAGIWSQWTQGQDGE